MLSSAEPPELDPPRRRLEWPDCGGPLPFTGTCEHHEIDPFAYLQAVLRRLPFHPADQRDELVPDVWFA